MISTGKVGDNNVRTRRNAELIFSMNIASRRAGSDKIPSRISAISGCTKYSRTAGSRAWNMRGATTTRSRMLLGKGIIIPSAVEISWQPRRSPNNFLFVDVGTDGFSRSERQNLSNGNINYAASAM